MVPVLEQSIDAGQCSLSISILCSRSHLWKTRTPEEEKKQRKKSKQSLEFQEENKQILSVTGDTGRKKEKVVE